LTIDIPPQTCRLQGPEADTPSSHSGPPCKGSLFRSQCRGNRSPPPSFQRQVDSCQLQSFECQRRHDRHSSVRCLCIFSGDMGHCPPPPASAAPV